METFEGRAKSVLWDRSSVMIETSSRLAKIALAKIERMCYIETTRGRN